MKRHIINIKEYYYNLATKVMDNPYVEPQDLEADTIAFNSKVRKIVDDTNMDLEGASAAASADTGAGAAASAAGAAASAAGAAASASNDATDTDTGADAAAAGADDGMKTNEEIKEAIRKAIENTPDLYEVKQIDIRGGGINPMLLVQLIANADGEQLVTYVPYAALYFIKTLHDMFIDQYGETIKESDNPILLNFPVKNIAAFKEIISYCIFMATNGNIYIPHTIPNDYMDVKLNRAESGFIKKITQMPDYITRVLNEAHYHCCDIVIIAISKYLRGCIIDAYKTAKQRTIAEGGDVIESTKTAICNIMGIQEDLSSKPDYAKMKAASAYEERSTECHERITERHVERYSILIIIGDRIRGKGVCVLRTRFGLDNLRLSSSSS